MIVPLLSQEKGFSNSHHRTIFHSKIIYQVLDSRDLNVTKAINEETGELLDFKLGPKGYVGSKLEIRLPNKNSRQKVIHCRIKQDYISNAINTTLIFEFSSITTFLFSTLELISKSNIQRQKQVPLYNGFRKSKLLEKLIHIFSRNVKQSIVDQ